MRANLSTGAGRALPKKPCNRMPAVSLRPFRPSLLIRLTVPFVAVIAALALVVGVLSYRAACHALEAQVQQLLVAAVQRVGEDLDEQRWRADAVLRVATQGPLPALDDAATALPALAQRLWDAVTLHPQPQGLVQWVNRNGQSLHVQRQTDSEGELGWRPSPQAPLQRSWLRQGVLPAAATAGDAAASTESAEDPRAATWYRAGEEAALPRWTQAQLDPVSQSLVHRRVRQVRDEAGRPVAVVSTTLDLRAVEQCLQSLPLPDGAVAFVLEQDGQLVALREGSAVRRAADGRLQRVTLSEIGSPLAWAVYQQLLPQLGGSRSERPPSVLIDVPDSGKVLASYGRTVEGAHEGWSVVVAVPRRTLSAPLTATAVHTAAATLVAVAVMLLLAAWLHRSLLRDARELVAASRRIGEGDLDTPVGPVAGCEFDLVRDGLQRLQLRLRNDRGLGLANREAVLNRLHDRMRPGRRHNDAPLIALLFVDLDRFRMVNQRHGRDAGDLVLQTVGLRLRQTVRDTDLVARWGSDEFVVLLDGVDAAENAQRVRDQVERVLRDPVDLGPGRDGAELEGTVGLALAPSDEQEPEVLLRAAEADMAQRKPPVLRAI